MKASLNWIKEFVAVEASSQEIADRLTLAGLEVEGLLSLAKGLEKVVTATLLKCEKHPEADRLSLCEVRAGDQQVSLVCGAKNMKVGDIVALAVPGATLPNGMTIQETVIRKVKSSGMLCSEKELGLATESEGILILPPGTTEGLPLAQALGLDDTILEINVTPNRGDCLSMLGLAREIAAAFSIAKLEAKDRARLHENSQIKAEVEVILQAPELCPRYTCRILRGVKVGPSPQHVGRRLEACGIRAINNVVDATNYVMLELGQPLHAFDLRQIRGAKVVIRAAAVGETLQTLDGQKRALEGSDLVIADGERVLALAGVMGGQDSGVENDTCDLLLESACFKPNLVRKTAKRLSLQTESSYRFERSVDPNGCLKALDRLTELLLDWAGGSAVSETVDCYPTPQAPKNIPLRSGYLKKVLGAGVDLSQLGSSLSVLGLHGKEKSVGEWMFQVPTFRSDLTREIDLTEEVARIYGYNRIETTYPAISLSEMPDPQENPLDRLRMMLVDWGFSEVLHYSFTSPSLLKKFECKFHPAQTLVNPLSEELSVMRPSLLPQMVQTLQKNIFNGSKNLRLFEIRPVYTWNPEISRMSETWNLCLGVSGTRRSLHFLEKEEWVSYYDLKGYLNVMLGLLEKAELREEALSRPCFHPKRQARLFLDSHFWGELGELHPAFLEELGARVPMVVAEINLDLFLTGLKNRVQFEKVSSFPSVWRDLNLVVDEGTPHGQVEAVIRRHGGPWVKRVLLFDLYRGQPLPEGKKALTYTLEYTAGDKTLTDEEVNQARELLLGHLKSEIRATLR